MGSNGTQTHTKIVFCIIKVGKIKKQKTSPQLFRRGGREWWIQLQHPFWLKKKRKKEKSDTRKRVRKYKRTNERTKGSNEERNERI